MTTDHVLYLLAEIRPGLRCKRKDHVGPKACHEPRRRTAYGAASVMGKNSSQTWRLRSLTPVVKTISDHRAPLGKAGISRGSGARIATRDALCK